VRPATPATIGRWRQREFLSGQLADFYPSAARDQRPRFRQGQRLLRVVASDDFERRWHGLGVLVAELVRFAAEN
jgi:hypothetical protein